MRFISDPLALESVYGPADDWSRLGEEAPRRVPLDDGHRAFMEATTMVVVATIGHGGVTCSPRGGPPGTLVIPEDDHTLWVPDAAGGRIHQTVRNLMEDPRIGLLLLAPDRDDTLRVEGMARVSTDPLALARFSALDPPVRSVMMIDIQLLRMTGSGPLRRARSVPDQAQAS